MSKTTTYFYESEANDPQQYYWFKTGLSKAEVDKVIKLASELPEAERATTIGSEDGGSTRSSMVKWLPQTNEWDWLYQRMMKSNYRNM